MITRATLSTIEQGLPKYRSMLAGNTAYSPGSYESIATVSVSSTVASISFTSIPATYKHLQIRALSKNSRSTPGEIQQTFLMRFNGDTGNNYGYHRLIANGSAISASGGGPTESGIYLYTGSVSNASLPNIFGVALFDILDYADTNKYKTTKYLGGLDTNSAGGIMAGGGLWSSTSAITSISIAFDGGDSHLQYSSFALYGIKGA